MKNEKIKIKNCYFVIILFCFFGLMMAGFVLANTNPQITVDAKKISKTIHKKPVIIKKTLTVDKSATVKKTLTVGTDQNDGKLYIKGVIQNPRPNSEVVVNDDLDVKGDLEIYGNLKVRGNFEKVTVIYSKDLADESVTTEKLAKKAVTTSRLEDNAVTEDKLASNAVTSGKIKAGAVKASEIEDGTITSAELVQNAVTADKIADSSVTTAKIADGTIINSDVNFSSSGFIKAGGYVAPDGIASDLFNNLTGSTEGMTVGKISAGYYGVTIPNLTTHDHVIVTAFMWGTNRGTVASLFSISTGGFVVYTSEPAGGSPQDAAFYFMVF